jgi:hypothetical protein
MVKPKRISVRPGNELEGGGIVVWVYHRKVQIQLHFEDYVDPNDAINEAIEIWHHAMEKLSK